MPIPPRSTAEPGSSRARPFVEVELDRRAGAPTVGEPGRPLLEQLEGAVVAGGHESGEHRRVEAAAGVLPRAQREPERLEQPAADRESTGRRLR